MRFTSTLLVALRALRRNTMRSMLTALGMIIGVAAVITMVSIGNGAKAQVEAQVAAMGQNLITVMPGSSSSGGSRGGYGSSTSLTPEDADAILAEEQALCDSVVAHLQAHRPSKPAPRAGRKLLGQPPASCAGGAPLVPEAFTESPLPGLTQYSGAMPACSGAL